MATDTKYCYISTTTSQSGSVYNYQNIPYRMPTTMPVIYQGSDADPLYYMPIAIWSNVPIFKNTVYYNNGEDTDVTYPLNSVGLSTMNQTSGPAMFGNGAGSSGTASGSKATPFFGRYQEHDGTERDEWQVYTGYTCGYGAVAAERFPPAAPIKISADYTESSPNVGMIAYDGNIRVVLYNYAEYYARAYIQLLAGSTVKYESNGYSTASPMTVSSSKLDPGTCNFGIKLSGDSDVRSITSIKVYWYSQSGNELVSYTYPVSFTVGGGSQSCTCTALALLTSACICNAIGTATEVCVCTGNSARSATICTCTSTTSKTCSCTSGNTKTDTGQT